MDLKELFGEDLFKQVSEKVGDKHKLAIVSDGTWIPKEKFDSVNTDKGEYKKQVDELSKSLGELKDKLKDNEGAGQQIADLQNQIKDKEAELGKARKESATKLAIIKANPKDVSDILPHIKQDSITITEAGEISGLEEQLKTLKEGKPYLFNEEVPGGTGGSKGGGPRRGGNETKNPWAKDSFNLTEQGKLLKENPELAKQYQTAAQS